MPSSRPPDDPEEGPVLGPEELDIERRENVVAIDEGRYVIASDVESAKRAEAIAAEAAERNAETVTRDGADGRADAGGRSDASGRNDPGGRTDVADRRSAGTEAGADAGTGVETGTGVDPGAGGRSPGSAPAGISPEDLSGEHVRRWHEKSLESVDSHYGFRLSVKAGDRIAHQQLFSDDVATLFDGLLTWYAGQLDRETPVEDVLGILLAESNVRTRFPPRTIKRILATHDLSLDDSIGELFGAAADGEGVVFPPDETSEFVFPADESD